MHSTFYKLLDNALAEVCRREESYTSRFPVAISPEQMTPHYQQHPLGSQTSAAIIEQTLVKGLAYVGKLWKNSPPSASETDPVARVLCDSIMDAFWADQGLLALQPSDDYHVSVSEVLASEYTERQASTGMKYYVRNRGVRPLLLINATGVPIKIWTQFLADPSHDFKIIVPQRRSSDLFQGGLQQHLDISTESSDLSSILEAESFQDVAVLAWCNGAAVAIDLVNRSPRPVVALVLLGPMLKGIRAVSPNPSSFERDLQPLLDIVTNEMSLAPLLAQAIAKQSIVPDWNRWLDAPIKRAQALFALPAKDNACGITAPLTEARSFINIARRMKSDESYPMDQALARLKARTMVILGSDDNIVSNELTLAAMKKMCGNSIVHISLSGSGHYIQDLQYHYFNWLLTEFLDKQRPPSITARILVEQLGHS
jgi:pimeloyl-ACP methyl ester carboxylesterase